MNGSTILGNRFRRLLRLGLVSFVSLLVPAASAVADERVIVERTDESTLPRGHGLAESFPGDVGIADKDQVIFADNFESGDFSKWDEYRKDESILSLIEDPAADRRMGNRTMRVVATLGENTGGGATIWFEPSDPVFVRFYVRFAEDCDYTHHLARIRANKGLQGRDKWSGFGQAGTRPRGDERFVTGVEPWGGNGRYAPPGRWNFYTYWPEMKASGDGKYWGNHFRPDDAEDIPRDRWVCLELMIKHNTPGERDGEQAFWVDGELRGHWTGLMWRTSPTLWANSLSLESYVTDRWTRNRVNTVDFDNVVIAKGYIGPTPPEDL